VDLPVKISPEGDIAHHPKGLVVGNDFGGCTGERSLSIYVILRADERPLTRLDERFCLIIKA
jgi:hypothetical protein